MYLQCWFLNQKIGNGFPQTSQSHKTIHEFLDDLKEEYDQNKVVISEFNTFVSELSKKLSPEDVEKLNSFSTRLYKVKRCAKKGVEAMRELARDQKKATQETIREYQEYLHT